MVASFFLPPRQPTNTINAIAATSEGANANATAHPSPTTMLDVAVAGVCVLVLGAVWYGLLADRWIKAASVDVGKIKHTNLPHVVCVAGGMASAMMVKEYLALAGVETPQGGFVAGLRLGVTVALPWILNTVLYSQHNPHLMWIDGGFAVLGMGVVGAVVTAL
jgi:hypothetical protein